MDRIVYRQPDKEHGEGQRQNIELPHGHGSKARAQ